MVFAFIFQTEDVRGAAGKGQVSRHVLSLQLQLKLKHAWKKSALQRASIQGSTGTSDSEPSRNRVSGQPGTSLDQTPSGASHKGALRPRPLSWAWLRPGLFTACLPAALASSRAGLGLHLGCHPGPGHQTHLHRTEEAELDTSFPRQGQGSSPLCPVPLHKGPVGDSRLNSAYRSPHHHALHETEQGAER